MLAWLNQPLATLLAAVAAALLTGAFAVYQLRRNSYLQRSIEEQRLSLQKNLEDHKQALQRDTDLYRTQLALAQSTLERRDESNYRFRIERLTPFIEALNRSVIHSYAAVRGLEVFAQLRGHFQALVQHGGGALEDWLKATQDMSNLRVQMLLSVDATSVIPLVTSLQEFVTLQKRILDERQAFLAQRATLADLHRIHSQYVRTGYKLMLDIRNAIGHSLDENTRLTEEQLDDLANKVVSPLENSSVVSVPFGKTYRSAWIAIWRLSEAMVRYEHIENGFAEVERSLMDLTTSLHSLSSVLEAKMLRIGAPDAEERTYALSVSFSDKKARDEFQDTLLPETRRKAKLLWRGFLAPTEITVD